MRNILVIILLLCGILGIYSCYYDNPPEPAPIDPELVSFRTHILPILNKSCSTSNCHDGHQDPDLTADVAWKNLTGGGFVNLVLPEESRLYKSVDYQENPMPPGGPQLSKLNRDLIWIWILKGAPND